MPESTGLMSMTGVPSMDDLPARDREAEHSRQPPARSPDESHRPIDQHRCTERANCAKAIVPWPKSSHRETLLARPEVRQCWDWKPRATHAGSSATRRTAEQV